MLHYMNRSYFEKISDEKVGTAEIKSSVMFTFMPNPWICFQILVSLEGNCFRRKDQGIFYPR